MDKYHIEREEYHKDTKIKILIPSIKGVSSTFDSANDSLIFSRSGEIVTAAIFGPAALGLPLDVG
jgi:hypothetical protein